MRKRRKRAHDDAEGVAAEEEESVTFSLDPLISVLRDEFAAHQDTFEDIMDPLLPEYEHVRSALQMTEVELDEYVRFIHPLLPCTRSNAYSWPLYSFIGNKS